MLGDITARRLACHEDFVQDDESWMDANLVERESTPISSDSLPSGRELNEENGGTNVSLALEETNRRIGEISTDNGHGMPSSMSIKASQLPSFQYRNLGGNSLIIRLYGQSDMTLEGFHNGSIDINLDSNVTASNGNPAITLVDCTASIHVGYSESFYRITVPPESECAVRVQNCAKVKLQCKFFGPHDSSSRKYAVVTDGSTVVFRSCSFNGVDILKTSSDGYQDKNSVLVEEAESQIDACRQRVNSVSAKVSLWTSGIVKHGTAADGTSYVLYGDRTNDYKGTLMMWKHGVQPCFFAPFELRPSSQEWNDNSNVQEIFSVSMPYSFADCTYSVSTAVGNPVNLLGTELAPFMVLDEDTNEYDLSDEIWAGDHATTENIMIASRVVSDYFTYSEDYRYKPNQAQKFVNRFFAAAVQKFIVSPFSQLDFGKYVLRGGSSSSWSGLKRAYEYTKTSGYTLDYVAIGEISEESYNQLITE